MSQRPTIDHYFMDMTQLVKARGTCPRRQVGAVVVKDKRLLTTGYNGAPRNFPHPIDQGCLRDELNIPRGMMADVCPCLHAEQNAIIQAATTGVSIDGADLYCTTQPCTQCSRMIANSGIRRVIFQDEYPDPLAIGILTTAGVELWMWDPESQQPHEYGQRNTFEDAQQQLREKWANERPDMVPRSPLAPVATGDTKIKAADAADDGSSTPPTVKGLRDLSADPEREALIKRMAHERAERVKKAREEAGL